MVLAEYRVPTFPFNQVPQLIQVELLPAVAETDHRGPYPRGADPDYEAQARRQKLFGDRGEKIVLDMEKARLRAAGQPTLADRVAKAEHDYEGFDIHSFDEDGNERHIEVYDAPLKQGR